MENKLTATQEQALILEQRQCKDLITFSPSNCYKYSNKIKTIADAISLPSKSLNEFKKAYGREWLIGYVSMWLIELNDYVNLKNKMSDHEMEFVSERIIDQYQLKITDLTLFFRNVKEGKYGDFYENLSGTKIMLWISEYWDARCEYSAMASQSKNEKLSLLKDAKEIHPDIVAAWKKGSEESKGAKTETNGIGSRLKARTNERVLQLLKTRKKLKNERTEKLQEYLVKQDVKSDTFDSEIYEMVESILETRMNHKLLNKQGS